MLPAASTPALWPAASRLASRAMPTGSLAPDSPSRMVPLRPATSRRPRTENTTAGSVGASAVPTSSAARQSKPNRAWARVARAAAVTKVPATPTQTTGPAAVRTRRHPLCIPPSNKMTSRATDATRWTVVTDSRPRDGTTSEATAAARRKIAGAGIRIRSLIRFDNTATVMATPTSSTSRAKCSTSLIAVLPVQSTCLACLIIRLIIQTIRRDRTGSDQIGEASNLSRPDPSGADQIDAEHQATDLAVGVGSLSARGCHGGHGRGELASAILEHDALDGVGNVVQAVQRLLQQLDDILPDQHVTGRVLAGEVVEVGPGAGRHGRPPPQARSPPPDRPAAALGRACAGGAALGRSPRRPAG